MTGEEGWWAAIDAAPGDAVVLLQFADWLDERGDARGGWFREVVENGDPVKPGRRDMNEDCPICREAGRVCSECWWAKACPDDAGVWLEPYMPEWGESGYICLNLWESYAAAHRAFAAAWVECYANGIDPKTGRPLFADGCGWCDGRGCSACAAARLAAAGG